MPLPGDLRLLSKDVVATCAKQAWEKAEAEAAAAEAATIACGSKRLESAAATRPSPAGLPVYLF